MLFLLYSELYLQTNKKQTWLPAEWPDLNVRLVVTFNFSIAYFSKKEKEWSFNCRNTVCQTAADRAAGHWDGNLATMVYFSELSDCGKISFLYSDIFLFFSCNWERD